MEARVQAFADVAERALSGPPLQKEIASLRKFLHKQQEHRFSGPEKAALFTAISRHHANPSSRLPSEGHTAGGNEAPVLKLIEDALKLPERVIGTAHKEALQKWYWALLGRAQGGAEPVSARLSVVDVTNAGVLTLMLLDGGGGEEVEAQLPSRLIEVESGVLRASTEAEGRAAPPGAAPRQAEGTLRPLNNAILRARDAIDAGRDVWADVTLSAEAGGRATFGVLHIHTG